MALDRSVDEAREASIVEEHRETYKGRNIVVRPRTTEAAAERAAAERAAAEAAEAETAEAELYIDDEPVSTVRNSAGMYIATGYAYDPQTSLTDLAQRIIDYRDATQQGEQHGHPEEPGQPDGG
jgi:hypothetical protein